MKTKIKPAPKTCACRPGGAFRCPDCVRRIREAARVARRAAVTS